MRGFPRSGITLVESLVVISLIGILLGLTVPAVQKSRDAADRASCLNSLRQMGVAIHTFHDAHKQLPTSSATPNKNDPKRMLSWMALILCQLGHDPLYQESLKACQQAADPRVNPPHVGFATVVPTFVCAADTRLLRPLTDRDQIRAAYTSYVGIIGAFPPGANRSLMGTIGYHGISRMNQIRDGTSQTLLAGERPPPDSLEAGWWYSGYNWSHKPLRGPNNGLILGNSGRPFDDGCRILKGTFGPGRTSNPCDRFHLWSLHSGGANFLFADASARFLAYAAEPVVMRLATRDGDEVVDVP